MRPVSRLGDADGGEAATSTTAAGATALCNDGTLCYAAHQQGLQLPRRRRGLLLLSAVRGTQAAD
jgi:hypothetical protein